MHTVFVEETEELCLLRFLQNSEKYDLCSIFFKLRFSIQNFFLCMSIYSLYFNKLGFLVQTFSLRVIIFLHLKDILNKTTTINIFFTLIEQFC